ncbi:MAG: hypothetical protein QM736_24830, partial [Vicinamibacterales bacterium]
MVTQQASPFLACTISSTPGAVGRDLSSAVPGLLTALGAFAIPAQFVVSKGLTVDAATLHINTIMAFDPTRTPRTYTAGCGARTGGAPYEGLRDIIQAEQDRFQPLSDFKTAVDTNWQYTFPTDAVARKAVIDL